MRLNECLSIDTDLKIVSGTETDLELKKIGLPDAPAAGDLIFLKNKTLAEAYRPVGGEVVVVAEVYWNKLASEQQEKWKTGPQLVLTGPDVALSMARLSRPFYEQIYQDFNDLVDGRQLGLCEIHPTAEISQHAFIAAGVTIEENVVIHSGVRVLGGSHIGAGTILYPNVVLYHQVRLGKNCRIHSQSVIGADGFGYHFDGKTHQKIWHMGGVQIEDDVEIGACSAVDQGTFSPTRIGKGSRLDNHVQIGHNCQLGQGVVICGHVAIGGSSKIGDYTVFGGKSGMGDNMSLGPACQVAGGALVNCDWPAKTVLGGHPARPLKEWMKGLAYVRKMTLSKSE